jgi:hypothetical protein
VPCGKPYRAGTVTLALNGDPDQVQVQVCFTSVDGQVQPLDVALGHSVLSKLCDSSAKWNISHLEYYVVSLISGQHPIANGA